MVHYVPGKMRGVRILHETKDKRKELYRGRDDWRRKLHGQNTTVKILHIETGV